MINKISKWILVAILTISVITGASLVYTRYFIELQSRNIELCVDYNDVKGLNLDLSELKKRGVVSIGLFEETLPDAVALGELYYTQGSSIASLKDINPRLYGLFERGLISTDKTYIQITDPKVRKRVSEQLKIALGKSKLKFLGSDVLEVDAPEEELRKLPIGLSEKQASFLSNQGFWIVPRVWNHKYYTDDNLVEKFSKLKDYSLIIFEGEEIVGFPNEIAGTARALKDNKIKYGYIEIINQYGNKHLRRLMKNDLKKVHSISKDEIKKLNYDEVSKRFVRAAKERKVQVLYLRPFDYPFLDFVGNLKTDLEKNGFVLGRAEEIPKIRPAGWQILILGLGVMIGFLFLVRYFVKIPYWLLLILTIIGGLKITFLGAIGYTTLLQKSLAFLAAITFPSLAVISTFSKENKRITTIWDSLFMVLNILAETMVGIFLIVGLLADYRFMIGAETFTGVKLALLLPIVIVAAYFILKRGLIDFLKSEVKMFVVACGAIILLALLILVARSGNFVIPVPGFEKFARQMLESILLIRPRTKEFLFGYPFLFLAAIYKITNHKTWLWLFAALGTVAVVSVTNSFTHIHTPIIVSLIRTFNGLELGVIIGLIVAFISNKILSKQT